MLEAKIKFFDIKRCGYYRRGDSGASFGDIGDVLGKLNSWATDGRSFVNTTCYQSDADNDLLNTYFCAWKRNESTGDSILILWNQTPNDNGVVYGMKPASPPGETSMLTTDFGDPSVIPGAPSYFWFVPDRNVFAGIRFEHSVQGKINLDYYINGFLQNKSPYRVSGADGVIIGYSLNGRANEQSDKIHPKFEALGRKQKELEDELVANVFKISKIIKKETLFYNVPDDRSIFERVFSNLLNNPPLFNQPRLITHELQFSPTVEELRNIINNFEELGGDTFIKNAGFVYKDGTRIMLTGANVAFKHEFPIARENNQIISPDALLAAVSSHRVDLLRPLDNPSFERISGT